MRIIKAYLFQTIFNAIALTLIVFLSLFFIFTLIDQLQAVRNGYTATEAFINVFLRLPNGFYTLMPFSCLIGCLAGLGSLATSSELVIVRAAGVSTMQIMWMVLRPAIAFIVAALLVGEFAAPYAEQTAISRKAIALNQVAKQSQQHSWSHGINEFMRFKAVLPNGEIFGVSRYIYNDQNQLVSASYTKRAVYRGDYWEESDVAITHLEKEKTWVETMPSRRWETELTPTLLNIVVLAPNELSIRNLFYYTNYLRSQNVENRDYSLSFWQKVLGPLATASLVLVAISFIFGPLRSVTMGQRVFTGVVFGVAFEVVQRLLGPSSLVFGFSPLFAVLIPIAACCGVGIYLLRRAR